MCSSCGVSSSRVSRGALAHLLARGEQLMPGAFGERVGAHGDERLVRDPQLLASVDAPALATQPLAVEQAGAGELRTQPGAPEAIDRFAVQALGGLALRQQRARPRLDAERPVGVAVLGVLAQPREAAAASSVFPVLLAASTSSLSDHMETKSSGVSSLASMAAASASS